MAEPADTPRGYDDASIVQDEATRRGFLAHTASVLVGGIICIVPFLSGLIVFLDPLRRSAGKAKLIDVAPLEAVPDDGVPHEFAVRADRQDAWNRYPNVPVGSVYLIRQPGQKTVKAFNATCPHLGCMVGYLPDKKYFRCPCHTSAFDLDGKRKLDISTVPPRDMDKLECSVKRNRIIVEFKNFYTGRDTPVEKT